MDYRQYQDTALLTESRDALFIVQGHQATSAEYLRSTAQELRADILHCCSEQYHHVA
jgi:DNA/RNA-binding domain of Phe-tRNA-synthetase-like protein